MSDKDLLVVISEMLRKQDQHSELLSKQTEILSKQTEMINIQTKSINEMGSSLNNFIKISINQFEQQQTFNEKFLEKLDQIGDGNHRNSELKQRVEKLEKAVFKSDGNS